MSNKFYSEYYKPTQDELINIRNRGIIRPSMIKRLPIIRHVRAVMTCYKINKHYDAWAKLGSIAWNARSDYIVCYAIWHDILLPPTPPQ